MKLGHRLLLILVFPTPPDSSRCPDEGSEVKSWSHVSFDLLQEIGEFGGVRAAEVAKENN